MTNWTVVGHQNLLWSEKIALRDSADLIVVAERSLGGR
jgi:hypothetical protein